MKKVEIIGAAIIDVMVSPAEEEVFQTGSYAAENILMTYGGDALNEATVLQSLGVPVYLETVIGQDEAGDNIRRHMEGLGMDLRGVHEKEDMNTSINVVLVKKDGERCFLTNPQGSQRQLQLADISMPFSPEIDILCFASIFVFPQIKNEEMKSIFARAKEQGIIVCADMTKCKNMETVEDIAGALKYVDYLLPNAEEAMLLTRQTTVEAAARCLVDAGVGMVVMKCGSKGCYIRSAVQELWIPAVAGVKGVDTTGAGDSFVAGFLYGLAKGCPPEECAAFGNRCGAEAVKEIGATTWLEKGRLPFT